MKSLFLVACGAMMALAWVMTRKPRAVMIDNLELHYRELASGE